MRKDAARSPLAGLRTEFIYRRHPLSITARVIFAALLLLLCLGSSAFVAISVHGRDSAHRQLSCGIASLCEAGNRPARWNQTPVGARIPIIAPDDPRCARAGDECDNVSVKIALLPGTIVDFFALALSLFYLGYVAFIWFLAKPAYVIFTDDQVTRAVSPFALRTANLNDFSGYSVCTRKITAPLAHLGWRYLAFASSVATIEGKSYGIELKGKTKAHNLFIPALTASKTDWDVIMSWCARIAP